MPDDKEKDTKKDGNKGGWLSKLNPFYESEEEIKTIDIKSKTKTSKSAPVVKKNSKNEDEIVIELPESSSSSSSEKTASAAVPKKKFQSRYVNPLAPRVIRMGCPPPGGPPRPYGPPLPPCYPLPTPWGYPFPPPPPICPPPRIPRPSPYGAKQMFRVPRGFPPPFAQQPQPPIYNNCNFYTTPPQGYPGLGAPPPFMMPPPPGRGYGGMTEGIRGYGGMTEVPCMKKAQCDSTSSLSMDDSDLLQQMESLVKGSTTTVTKFTIDTKTGKPITVTPS